MSAMSRDVLNVNCAKSAGVRQRVLRPACVKRHLFCSDVDARQARSVVIWRRACVATARDAIVNADMRQRALPCHVGVSRAYECARVEAASRVSRSSQRVPSQ